MTLSAPPDHVVFWNALAWLLARLRGGWTVSMIEGRCRKELRRVGRQDKSREVRHGRSGRETLQINGLHDLATMCGESPRRAELLNPLIFRPFSHLAGYR